MNSVKKKNIFPDSGELFKSHLSQSKKNTPLVFFVHFFGGNKKILKRHVDFINELGFDAYVFNLNDSLKYYSYFPYSKISKKFGLKHVVADQIEKHLEQFPQYKYKIIFSFSNISGCAIEAVSRRMKFKNKKDVKAFICDSGPGIDVIRSSYDLIKYQFKVNSFLLRVIETPLVAYSWSLQLNKDIHSDLEKFPDNFPLLSIRGWRDQLISPKSIDKIFEPHKNLKWKKLNLPEAGHVNGLRDFPSEYKPAVESFLQQLQFK